MHQGLSIIACKCSHIGLERALTWRRAGGARTSNVDLTNFEVGDPSCLDSKIRGRECLSGRSIAEIVAEVIFGEKVFVDRRALPKEIESAGRA